jgi:hypothetical protein
MVGAACFQIEGGDSRCTSTALKLVDVGVYIACFPANKLPCETDGLWKTVALDHAPERAQGNGHARGDLARRKQVFVDLQWAHGPTSVNRGALE